MPAKKAKLRTYGDMAKYLWDTFTKLASDYARIDIIFVLYIIYSINDIETNRRNEVEGNGTDILNQNSNLLLTQKTFGQLVKIK